MECPYPPIGSTCLLEPEQGFCGCQRRPIVHCPTCNAGNRALARFCRSCGARLDIFRWSSRGGESGNSVLETGLTLDPKIPAAWETRLSEPISAAPVVLGGLFLGLDRNGHLVVLDPTSSVPLFHGPLAGVSQVVASPAGLEGLLLVASEGKLVAVDLVELLELSPGSSSRRAALPLRGTLCSHLATNGVDRAAAATVDEERLLISVFGLDASGQLIHQWTRSPGPLEGGDAFASLAFLEDHLLVGTPDGRLWFHGLESGRLVGEDRVPEGLARANLLGRGRAAFVAGADNALHLVEPGDGLRRTSLAHPDEGLVYALGASNRYAVCCQGRTIRRVELRSGKLTELELPQYCTTEPIVGRDWALAVSNEGTLYHLSLAGNQMNVLSSRRLFPAHGAVPAPPAPSSSTVFVCGPRGEVVAVPVSFSRA